MIKQSIVFSNPASLSLRYGQLVIRRKDDDTEITRPIEDIGTILIDNQMVQMTMPLMNALVDNNVAVIVCDDHSMPNAMVMPLVGNSTQQETYRIQLEASVPTQKRIWKTIVESKIRNQAALLDKLGKRGDMLRPYYSNVLSGDSDNREGAAARVYWQQMFGPHFARSRDGDQPNALLNYGYTILRAAVARALIGSGLLPAFGLFHRNRYNAFPLADDVMEPYRPFVDEIVYDLYTFNPDMTLDKYAKQQLISVLVADVVMGKQKKPLQVALSTTTASLARALKDNKQTIEYPLLSRC